MVRPTGPQLGPDQALVTGPPGLCPTINSPEQSLMTNTQRAGHRSSQQMPLIETTVTFLASTGGHPGDGVELVPFATGDLLGEGPPERAPEISSPVVLGGQDNLSSEIVVDEKRRLVGTDLQLTPASITHEPRRLRTTGAPPIEQHTEIVALYAFIFACMASESTLLGNWCPTGPSTTG